MMLVLMMVVVRGRDDSESVDRDEDDRHGAASEAVNDVIRP